MRKSFLSKVTVATLATAMIFTQGIPASAELTGGQVVGEDGNASGNATGVTENDLSFEGHVNKNVIKAVVPTITNEDMYKAILDPEGLIPATSVITGYNNDETPIYGYFNAAGGRKPEQFDGSTMYFKNIGADEEGNEVIGYSSVSDAMTITNKGTVPLDISLDVTLSDQKNILVNDSEEFDGNIASMYMAIADENGLTYVGTEKEVPVDPDDTSAGTKTVYTGNVKAFVAGADESLYHIDGHTGAYTFEENTNKDEEGNDVPLSLDNFGNYSFQITGGCNPKGIYSKTETDNSDPDNPVVSSAIDVGKLDVVWTLNEAYKLDDTPVVAEYIQDEEDATTLAKQFVYLYGDMEGAAISANVSNESGTPDVYTLGADIKVAGPGMDIADAVVVDGGLADIDAEDSAAGQIIKVGRDKIVAALSGSTDDSAKACINAAGTDIIPGNYRVLYTVGGIEFAGVVVIPEIPTE